MAYPIMIDPSVLTWAELAKNYPLSERYFTTTTNYRYPGATDSSQDVEYFGPKRKGALSSEKEGKEPQVGEERPLKWKGAPCLYNEAPAVRIEDSAAALVRPGDLLYPEGVYPLKVTEVLYRDKGLAIVSFSAEYAGVSRDPQPMVPECR